MIKRPHSRVGLILFEPTDRQVLVDLQVVEGNSICEVMPFGTSVVINNGEDILWNDPENPRDWVVLVDNRPQTKSIHSVLKGSSGEIERFSVNYSSEGILAVFKLLKQPVLHPIFTQKWRFNYVVGRRVVATSHKEKGLEVRTY